MLLPAGTVLRYTVPAFGIEEPNYLYRIYQTAY